MYLRATCALLRFSANILLLQAGHGRFVCARVLKHDSVGVRGWCLLWSRHLICICVGRCELVHVKHKRRRFEQLTAGCRGQSAWVAHHYRNVAALSALHQLCAAFELSYFHFEWLWGGINILQQCQIIETGFIRFLLLVYFHFSPAWLKPSTRHGWQHVCKEMEVGKWFESA